MTSFQIKKEIKKQQYLPADKIAMCDQNENKTNIDKRNKWNLNWYLYTCQYF